MYLYLIERLDRVDYEEFDGFVVAASTAHDARRTAQAADHTYGNGETWTDPTWTKIRRIGTAREGTDAGVILASFTGS